VKALKLTKYAILQMVAFGIISLTRVSQKLIVSALRMSDSVMQLMNVSGVKG
jgi:hypothetical protein